MLTAKPVSLLSDGQQIAYLDLALWREAAELQVQDESYRLSREGLLSGAFLLEADEGWQLARATKPSAFRSRYELEIDSHDYSVMRTSAFTRTFSVLDGDQEIARIWPAGILSRSAFIQLPAAWSQAVQIFVFWLVLVIWNRAEGST